MGLILYLLICCIEYSSCSICINIFKVITIASCTGGNDDIGATIASSPFVGGVMVSVEVAAASLEGLLTE